MVYGLLKSNFEKKSKFFKAKESNKKGVVQNRSPMRGVNLLKTNKILISYLKNNKVSLSSFEF